MILHWRQNRFYLHGFSAIDTPASLGLATMIYNDLGIGYVVCRSVDMRQLPCSRSSSAEPAEPRNLTHPSSAADLASFMPVRTIMR
jgi:hypothetical protein